MKHLDEEFEDADSVTEDMEEFDEDEDIVGDDVEDEHVELEPPFSDSDKLFSVTTGKLNVFLLDFCYALFSD